MCEFSFQSDELSVDSVLCVSFLERILYLSESVI